MNWFPKLLRYSGSIFTGFSQGSSEDLLSVYIAWRAATYALGSWLLAGTFCPGCLHIKINSWTAHLACPYQNKHHTQLRTGGLFDGADRWQELVIFTRSHFSNTKCSHRLGNTRTFLGQGRAMSVGSCGWRESEVCRWGPGQYPLVLAGKRDHKLAGKKGNKSR